MAATYMADTIKRHASAMPNDAKQVLEAAQSIEEALNEDIEDDGMQQEIRTLPFQ